jgi:hypothetical protein
VSWPRSRLLLKLPSELPQPAALVLVPWAGSAGVSEWVVGLLELLFFLDAPAPAVGYQTRQGHQKGQASQAAQNSTCNGTCGVCMGGDRQGQGSRTESGGVQARGNRRQEGCHTPVSQAPIKEAVVLGSVLGWNQVPVVNEGCTRHGKTLVVLLRHVGRTHSCQRALHKAIC